jgi:serine/threonine protein kinase
MDSSKKDKEAALHPFILLKELLETKEDDAIKKRDLKFMKLNFGLPSNFDKFVLEDRPLFETIDKEFLKKEDRYYPNPEYYSNSEKNMYKEIISNKYDEHMIFDKALGDLKKNKLNINSVGMLLNYYKELRESIVPGIHFLHIHGLAHFDIKVDNIFVYKVDGKITFKLADFDLLTRIQDRVDNPKDNYILGVMRSDDYIYYPPAIDAYTYRKKLLKLAVTNYSRQPNTFEKKQTKLDATEQGNVSETVQHEPIPAANNIKSKFVNTDITNIRRDSELPDDTFAILSYRFYLTYMKTIIEKLNKYAEDINYFYILSINIDVLCKEHKLETSEIKKLIKEIAEIKYGVMDDGEFASGEISNIVYWENIEENVNKIYAYFAPGNSFNAVGFYSFIAKYTDIYAFCILLLNLLNSYIEEIVLKQDLWSLQKYVENVEFILQFIKTYLSVNAYLEPGMNVNIRSVEPIDIFNKAYNMFLSVLESKIK